MGNGLRRQQSLARNKGKSIEKFKCVGYQLTALSLLIAVQFAAMVHWCEGSSVFAAVVGPIAAVTIIRVPFLGVRVSTDEITIASWLTNRTIRPGDQVYFENVNYAGFLTEGTDVNFLSMLSVTDTAGKTTDFPAIAGRRDHIRNIARRLNSQTREWSSQQTD